MGFIDWLTKDKSVEIKDEEVTQNEEVTEEFNEEELSSLKELSNSERQQTLDYPEQEEDEEDYSPIARSDNSINNYQTMGVGISSQQNASFTIFKVSDEEDVRQVLKHVTTNAPCIATFENIKRKAYIPIMKYLQGGLFVMGANMSEWQSNSYIIVPKGMAINMQEKTKRKR